MVHWLYHYHQLKSINVAGTIEVLKFAITSKVKPIHYISTTNVYDTDEHKNKKFVGESEVGATTKGLTGGYTQSKWISEQLIQKARKRDIPVRIYRPSYITGDSQSGIWNADDFLCRFIKGCIQLKHAPRLPDLTLDMSAVDYVANAIVNIAMNPQEKRCEFNVVQDHLYSYNELFETMKSYGYDLQIIEYEKWRELLILQESNNDFALRPFIALFNEKWPQSVKGPVYESSNTRKTLANTEIKNITIDKVIDKYFSYFISCGFLNPPEQPKNKNIDWYPKQQATLNYRNKNLITNGS
jgi:L-aminoadipate-semialdehyde dehydrogenase